MRCDTRSRYVDLDMDLALDIKKILNVHCMYSVACVHICICLTEKAWSKIVVVIVIVGR